MKKINQDEWLFFVLSLIGVVSLVGMGMYNLSLRNELLGWIELGMGTLGIVNGMYFWKLRRLDLATHIVLSLMLTLLVIVLWSGGMHQLGWLWIFTYPPLAFALKKVSSASWYVAGLGIVIAIATVVEILGINVSVYNAEGLIQLCLSYMVVSLMVSMGERAHEKIEQIYLMQGNEIEYEKRLLAVRANELRIFKTAVEQSGEMMIMTDPEGVVLWANAAAEKATGFDVVEIVGKKAGVLWGKLMDSDYYRNLWSVIKKEKKMFTGEILNHRKNTEHFYSTITIYPLLDANEEVEYFVATQRDITEQKEVDQMKTEFVSLVSHQLRTPLSSMRWNLEMLENGDLGKLTQKQKKLVSEVGQSNMRMINLISALLNISHIESGNLSIEPNQVSLNDYLTKLSSECSVLKKGQKLKLMLGSDDVKARVDSALLRQILLNFVSNASRYGSEEGEITIALEKEGESFVVSVRDHGFGIPQMEQRKVFGKFFRASNIRRIDTEGTGMGLYVASLIAKILGGSVGFESKLGQGSTFWVKLPIKGVPARAGEVRLR